MGLSPNWCQLGRRAAIALAGTVVASGATGCGGSGKPTATVIYPPTPAPSAARRHEAREATKALRRHGTAIEGFFDRDVVTTGIECDARVGGMDLIDCSFGQGVGGEDPSFFVVRLQSDGTLTKVLGKADPVPGPKSSAQTSARLASDDHLQFAPRRTKPWQCAPSPRIELDRSQSPSQATGQLCSAFLRVSKTTARRYVEFAPDGSAVRDYVLPAG